MSSGAARGAAQHRGDAWRHQRPADARPCSRSSSTGAITPEERFEEALAEIEEAVAPACAIEPASRWRPHLIGHLAPTDDPDAARTGRAGSARCPRFRLGRRRRSANGARRAARILAGSSAPACAEVLLGGLGRPERNGHGPDEHTTIGDIVGAGPQRACLSRGRLRRRPQPRPEHPRHHGASHDRPQPPPSSSPPPAVSPSALSTSFGPARAAPNAAARCASASTRRWPSSIRC